MSAALMDVTLQEAPKVTSVGSNGAGDPLAEIGRKLDLLTRSMVALNERMDWLAEQADAQRRRQQEWDELWADLSPILREAYGATVEQMSGLEHYVQLEDLQMLARRLARNTRNINELLELMESGFELYRDMSPLVKEVVGEAVTALDGLERRGYFGFVRQGQYVLDQVVTSFSEEDVRQLGDNVVLILNTVKALTQPEMMNLINNLTQGFHEAEKQVTEQSTSLLSLLREMRDPDVRRGLAITLRTLKLVSHQAPQKPQTMVNGK
jgi:uncharacterized protein YjgD (DUF1641 family)